MTDARYETGPIHPRRVTASGPAFVTGVLPKCETCPLPAGHEDAHEHAYQCRIDCKQGLHGARCTCWCHR